MPLRGLYESICFISLILFTFLHILGYSPGTFSRPPSPTFFSFENSLHFNYVKYKPFSTRNIFCYKFCLTKILPNSIWTTKRLSAQMTTPVETRYWPWLQLKLCLVQERKQGSVESSSWLEVLGWPCRSDFPLWPSGKGGKLGMVDQSLGSAGKRLILHSSTKNYALLASPYPRWFHLHFLLLSCRWYLSFQIDPIMPYLQEE